MCGIIGYRGDKDSKRIVIEGLKSLEYRGYDSWGIATVLNDRVAVFKKVGKIGGFSADQLKMEAGRIAIGHTRWATHGNVTEANAHPHVSCDGKIAVVHNGIIENYQELKAELKDHKFVSQTDTEIIPHLIEGYVREGYGFVEATKRALSRLEGRFAVVAVMAGYDGLIGARRGSPLVLGLGGGEREYFIASDIPAFLNHTRNVVFLEDNELVVLNKDYRIMNIKTGEDIKREPQHIDWDAAQAEKGDYPHFMIKEVLEQRDTVSRAIKQSDGEIMEVAKMLNDSFGSFFVACGTAGKVALAGTYLFSRIANKHVNFSVSSEFPNYTHFLTDKTLMIVVSQSGETADTLEAMDAARAKGVKIVGVVNVMGSTITRQADRFLLVKAGPEKCVASTKATTGQLAIVTLLAYACAGRLEEGRELLEDASAKINAILTEEYVANIRALAEKIKGWESMYIIGRGLNYPMALEAAIKVQEVSYIHAEGFAGGELKHGPIALISNGTPCIVLVANDETKPDILSNAVEVKARGGFIIGVAPKNNEVFDFWIPVPDVGNASPIVNIIPVQILAYHLAVLRGCNPDMPRNLAKSVTVK
ncbi:glutamine--fructose-6-phosphate transaminase (isomerizing) [Candidatus Woesearchaeota archaeon CG08_land_8_20_14_0_20_47_9]|nr:MAG: glutamine--fructose-6-phosphate aminotransferase [Candidatus Woesearchaeota archaeon CG1_02_47_18]PIO03473.1 MAG: glutamine--fructose-6-phosphate transaminase (isomerizing) [Candidatus Woesearchaeota archaeon CG08_land_8_20_14_0_20_47_9]HII30097.1 glutamine--fructose-6-phosphate transaminase (isomerizing) [Candidatus Woesearchaeota archaeon]